MTPTNGMGSKRPRPYTTGVRAGVDSHTRGVWAGRLRKARDARGYSQRELAERVGCTRASVSAWERGIAAPYLETRRVIARALGTPMAVLFPEVLPRTRRNNNTAA